MTIFKKACCKASIMSLLLLLVFSSCTTTYYLVRHAEKADNSSDPELSEAGHIRAGALKDLLLPKNIDTIFVSSVRRTQQTADSLAAALNKKYAIYPASLQGNQQLIRQLKSLGGNRGILVIGHSNTIPVVIDSLMGDAQQITISENDFDNLYTVSVKRFLSVKRRLKTQTYGTPTP